MVKKTNERKQNKEKLVIKLALVRLTDTGPRGSYENYSVVR